MPGAAVTPLAVGYCGKAPRYGDFVARGLPAAARRQIEDWLSAGLAASRKALGDGFDAAWRRAPLWRFAARPGGLAAPLALGAVGPSVDSVGRCYPLCVAALFDGDAAPERALAAQAAFLAAAEDFLLDALDPGADLDALFAGLPAPAAMAAGGDGALGDGASAWATLGVGGAPVLRVSTDGPPDPAAIMPRLLAVAPPTDSPPDPLADLPPGAPDEAAALTESQPVRRVMTPPEPLETDPGDDPLHGQPLGLDLHEDTP